MPAGRPSDYTEDKAQQLCAYLCTGMSLRTACKQKDMPDPKTVYKWMADNPEFLQQYARAKEESADALVEEMLDIADDQEEDAASRRVRIDTRKWIASKLKAKKYGDKLALEGGDKPIEVDHKWEVLPVASGRSKPKD